MPAVGGKQPFLDGDRWRGLKERHLDLLLAEELAVNPSFARWFADGAPRGDDGEVIALTTGRPRNVTTTVSVWDSANHPEAAGETDVLVRLEWDDGFAVGLFVEDKLDAVFQPWQSERYAARAGNAAIPTGTVLVAPAAFIARYGTVHRFDKAVSLEDMAAWLRDSAVTTSRELAARLRWRADALEVIAAARPPAIDDERAVRFTTMFAEAVGEGPGCVVDRLSCHTAQQGWIWFREPKALGYKVIHGMVDLYVKDVAPDPGAETVAQHLAGRLPIGFIVDKDTKGNTVLRARVDRPVNPITAFGPDGGLLDPITFAAAAAASREAARWLVTVGGPLLKECAAAGVARSAAESSDDV